MGLRLRSCPRIGVEQRIDGVGGLGGHGVEDSGNGIRNIKEANSPLKEG